MNRIIIDNRSDLSDIEAVQLTARVIKQGRISNDGKQYSYGTTFRIGDRGEYGVWSDLNKCSDKFTITKQP